MADVNANIRIDINATQALAQLRKLQAQISAFNASVTAGNTAAAASQAAMASSLASMIGATGQFNTSVRTMQSGVGALGTAFDKGTLSAKQYFRYAGSQVPGLTRAFRGLGVEQAQMANLASDRVKRLQTQYVDLGKDVRGMQKVMAITPKNLAAGYATDLALAQQRQQLFNRALQLGSTGLVNWGKNTQWAGRQLMVGFTIPLTIAAGAAAKFFMELDKASMQFRRVYGDMNTSTAETERNLKAMMDLGKEYTKYGIAVKDVIDVSARAAATGAQNEDLMAATEQTLRLATLGQMEYQRALDATISLQTAFAINSEDLGNKIDFLNAVENQTVLTMEDMALAVPRVAPVIKGLGGDVEDLAVFMTALREGGVSAEQGANALKSGLASLINPTARARDTLKGFGVNIDEIVQTNKGDLMGTVKAFGEALDTLGEFERQQSLEAVFGKYQYARLGALFKNVANDASQSARAMELAGLSAQELAQISEKELGVISETVTSKFLASIERLKVAIAPLGEVFLKAVTPIINAVSSVADWFNNLPDAVKNAAGIITAVIGGIAPVALMTFGLVANAIGNGIKAVVGLGKFMSRLSGILMGTSKATGYQTMASLDAAAAMASLEGKVSSLTSDLLMQTGAVKALASVYRDLAAAASGAAAAMPRSFAMPRVGARGTVSQASGGARSTIFMNSGGTVPGVGNKDTIPAMLTPGEMVINKKASAAYGPVLAAMNAGNLPGFNDGFTYFYKENAVYLQDKKENEAQKASPPKTQGHAPVLTGRIAEAMGMKVTQRLVDSGKFDKISKEVDKFSGKFTERVSHHFEKTYASIADPVARQEKAWKAAGKDLGKEGDALAKQLARNDKEYKKIRKAIKRNMMVMPDVYNTMTTASPSADKTLQQKREPVIKRTSAGSTVVDTSGRTLKVSPVQSYSETERQRAILALQKRMYPGQTFGPQQFGHVGERAKVPISEVEKLSSKPGVRTTKDVDFARRSLGLVAKEEDKAEKKKEKKKKTADEKKVKNAEKQGRKEGGSFARGQAAAIKDAILRGGAGTTDVAKTIAQKNAEITKKSILTGKSFAPPGMDSARAAAAVKMKDSGMTGKQVARSMRKYGSRITPGYVPSQSEYVPPKQSAGRVAQLSARSAVMNAKIAATAGSMMTANVVSALSESKKTMTAGAKTAAKQSAPLFSSIGKAFADPFKKEVSRTQLAGPKNTARGTYDPNLRAAAGGGRGFAPTVFLPKNAINELKQVVTGTTRALKQLPESFRDNSKQIGQSYKGLRESVSAVGKQVSGDLKKAWAPVATQFKTGTDALKNSFNNVKTTMTNGAEQIKRSFANIFGGRGGTGGGGGILGGMFGGGRGPMDPEARQARAERWQGRGMAAGMGLSMGAMIPFMAQDEEGKFMGMNANMLGMGMMGGGALLSMVGLLSGKFIALTGIVAAAGVAIYAWRNSVDNAARKAAEFGSNIGGAANALNNMASMLGRATPAQRQTQMRLGFTEEEEVSFGEFQSMFETEAGQKFINDLKDATSTERFNMLSQYIKTAVAAGLMDVDVAPAFAKTVAVALEDAFLGASMARAINDGLAKGSSGLLELAQQRESSVQQNQAMRNIATEDRISYEDSATAIGASIQIIQDFSNAAALAKEEYVSGTISYEQYISVLDEATEVQAKYSGVLNDAITKTSDLGATAQAIKSQLSLFLSPEDLTRVTEAADYGGGGFFAAGPGLKADTGERDQKRELEAKTLVLMTEAIISGMSAASVAAIQQYMKDNPESSAAQTFNKYAGQGGEIQFKAAAMAENLDILGIPEKLQELLTKEQIVDITMNFEKSGGDAADFEAFIASIPEEKIVDVMLAFKGMSAEDQMKFVNSFTNLSNLLGTENANKVDQLFYQRAAATTTANRIPGVPGGVTTTTLGQQKTGIEQQLTDKRTLLSRQQYGAGASTAQGQESIAKTKAEVDALELKLEEIESKIYEIKMQLDPKDIEKIEEVMNQKIWDEDTTLKIIEIIMKKEGDLDSLPQYVEWASQLQALPEEIRKVLEIDTNNMGDLEKFGVMVDDLNLLIPMLEKVPDSINKDLAISLMMRSNGKVATPEQYARNINKILAIQKDFESGDIVLQKKAILELIQEFRGPDGSQLTEEQALNAFNDLVARFGAQQLARLPWDVIQQVIAVETDVAGIDAAIAALRAAQKLAPEGWMAQRIDALNALKAAAQNMQVSLVQGGSIGSGGPGGGSPGGGNSGGGGGGEEDPLKAMIKDLKLQQKLVGDYVKQKGKVKSGFAEALRNAGAPEYLIAEIIAKGQDGLKIAKKLLKDKQKKLKELMKLSLEVARATFMESQRASMLNFRNQSAAQNLLLGSGVGPAVAMDIASDPQTAEMIQAERRKVIEAENELERARKKGKGEKQAEKKLAAAKRSWQELTQAIKDNTLATAQNEAIQASLEAQQEAINAQNQLRAALVLSGKGLSGDEIAAAIQSPGVANAVVGYMDKINQLKKEQQDLIAIREKAGKEWKKDKYKDERNRLKEVQTELRKVNGDYEKLIQTAKNIPKWQRRAGVVASALGFTTAAINLRKQRRAETTLLAQGYTPQQARDLASDEDTASSIVDAQKDVDDAQARLASLEARRKKTKRGSDEWKALTQQIEKAKTALDDAKKAQDALNNSISEMTKEQRKSLISGATTAFDIETDKTKTRRRATEILMGRGLTYDQAASVAGNEESAGAVLAAQQDVTNAQRTVDDLEKQREGVKKGSAEWKRLTALIEAAKEELNRARNAQDNLTTSIQNSVAEQQRLSWLSVQEKINEEIAKQANGIKFVQMGIEDQLVLNRLNALSLEDQNYFLSLTKEQQDAFLASLSQSIPLADKLAEAFNKVAASQKLQNLLNEEAANDYMGKTTEEYDDQLKSINKQIDAQQDLLKGHQKTIDILQEENDDLNRGLDLISRQEEKINEAFDKRIEALDKVEQANARIAQQQQNQLNLAQALSTGDIYAATQAAQQIKQDNAIAAIENTREALELAREEQLKNLVVEVNGQLLTREQIQQRIESNDDRIYQIQEDLVEPIEAVIDSLNDQALAVNRLKDQWQEYYDTLEDNAVDPLTGLKYKDLNRLKEFYDAARGMGMEAAAALRYAIQQTGIDILPTAFYDAFDIEPPSASNVGAGGTTSTGDWSMFSPAYQSSSAADKQFVNKLFGDKAPTQATFEALDAEKRRTLVNALAGGLSEEEKTQLNSAFGITPETTTDGETGGETTADINAGKQAAIAALPEVVKVRDAARAIKQAVIETPPEILKIGSSIFKNVQPQIENASASTEKILNKFKSIGKYIIDEFIPNSLTPFKDFIAKNLIDQIDRVINKFVRINTEILNAITNVGNLSLSLASMQKEIIINIVVNTTYTSSGNPEPAPTTPSPGPKPPKPPKKFAGGLIKMATGGMIPGGVPRDSVPILASPGEFIVRNAMVAKYGLPMLNDINQGSFQSTFRNQGSFQPTFRTPSTMSYAKVNKTVENKVSRTMYNNNYSINVTANTNANADEIASATVMRIRQMNSMQIRGARG